jgi:hypothetical protein
MEEKTLFGAKDFRKELEKIMPGYAWTVHKNRPDNITFFSAAGTQSSGFNRMSTLAVNRGVQDGRAYYEVMSSGYGLRAPMLHACSDCTLARALRKLQDHYEQMASKYKNHFESLETGRSATLAGK